MVTLIFAYIWDSLMAPIKHSFALKILPTWLILLPHVWWFDNIHAASSWCAFPRRRTKGKGRGSSAIAKRSIITLWNSSELFSSAVCFPTEHHWVYSLWNTGSSFHLRPWENHAFLERCAHGQKCMLQFCFNATMLNMCTLTHMHESA